MYSVSFLSPFAAIVLFSIFGTAFRIVSSPSLSVPRQKLPNVKFLHYVDLIHKIGLLYILQLALYML